MVRSWFRKAARTSPIRKAKPRALRFEALEERACPVIGAYEIPVIGPGQGYDGIVRLQRASGALLSSARHVLTAAHVDNPNSTAGVTFNMAGATPNGITIVTPGATFNQHPLYFLDSNPNQEDRWDIGVKTLAELAPLTAERWDIYRGTDELGKVGALVGWGSTGTGTIGTSTDVALNQYWATATGRGRNFELVRITFNDGPSGGSFRIRSGASTSAPLAFNANAGQIAAAFNSLPNLSLVQVRLVGDTDNDGIVDDLNNPNRGSFEAIIVGTNTVNHNTPPITLVDNLVGGSVSVEQLLAGGSQRIRTGGLNAVGGISADGTRLYADFDDGTESADILNDGLGQGANEAYGSWGDSGSPLIINGKIAGVLEGIYNVVDTNGATTEGHDGLFGSSDFGSFDTWQRVSTYAGFIDGITNQSFALVLNMANQPLGMDGNKPDAIGLSRVGDQFQIRFNGDLVYSEKLSLITSITVRGSGDDETFTLNNLNVGVPVTILGGAGEDRVIVTGSTPTSLTIDGQQDNDAVELRRVGGSSVVTVNGSQGTDAVSLAVGDLDARIFGQVVLNGPALQVTLDDSNGVNSTYTINKTTFDKNTMPGFVTLGTFDSIHLTTADGGNTVQVAGLGSNRALTIDSFGGADAFLIGEGRIAQDIQGELQINAGFGNDTVQVFDFLNESAGVHFISPISYSQIGMQGDIDFHFVDKITLYCGSKADSVTVDSDDPGVEIEIEGSGGKDSLHMDAPPQGLVRFLGGSGEDSANLKGTAGVDSLRLVGNRAIFEGAGEVRFSNVQTQTYDALGGADLITIEGIAGSVDDVHIFGSETANAGRIDTPGVMNLSFINVESLDAIGNEADNDQLTFHGTGVADRFVARLNAAGTETDPVLRFQRMNGVNLLKLRDYAGFASLNMAGGDGSDRFQVYVGPEAPRDRNIRVSGDNQNPADPGPGDVLQIFYPEPRSRVSHVPSPTTPGSGKVVIGYPIPRIFGIDYDGMEAVFLVPQ